MRRFQRLSYLLQRIPRMSTSGIWPHLHIRWGGFKHAPSYEKGTDSVPKTGPAILHKGEKVTPAKDNPASVFDKVPGNKAAPASKPADLAAAQATPGTSTSTGGATATRNSGAATGGAVTVTISGSSSTDTATTTGAGAGKGAGQKPNKGGKETPNVYNISIDATGRSGDAADASGKTKE